MATPVHDLSKLRFDRDAPEHAARSRWPLWVGFVGGFLPALRASRLQVVEAIRQ